MAGSVLPTIDTSATQSNNSLCRGSGSERRPVKKRPQQHRPPTSLCSSLPKSSASTCGSTYSTRRAQPQTSKTRQPSLLSPVAVIPSQPMQKVRPSQTCKTIPTPTSPFTKVSLPLQSRNRQTPTSPTRHRSGLPSACPTTRETQQTAVTDSAISACLSKPFSQPSVLGDQFPASPRSIEKPLPGKMPFPALPSASQVRKRCSAAFSTHYSPAPSPSVSSGHEGYSNRPRKHSRAEVYCPTASPVPSPASPATIQHPIRMSSLPSPKRMPTASSFTSFSSLRLRLFSRSKPKSCTRKGLEISAPIELQNQNQRQMRDVPNFGEDENAQVEGWYQRYEELRSATPPTPVRYQIPVSGKVQRPGSSEQVWAFQSKIAPRRVASKQGEVAIFRSDSVRSHMSVKSSQQAGPRSPVSLRKSGSAGASIPPRIADRSSTSSDLPLIQDHRPLAQRRPIKNWTSKLARGSKSSLNLVHNAVEKSRKGAIPPARPPRAEGHTGSFETDPSAISSLGDLDAACAGPRIDAYGWQNIKPLPGRGRLTPDSDVPHPSESVNSGSSYSLPSEGNSTRHAGASSDRRTEKHRRAAYWALDGETRRRQKRDPQSSSRKPRGVNSIVAEDSASSVSSRQISSSSSGPSTSAAGSKQTRLTMVEEETESNSNKSLPAMSAKCSAFAKPVEKRKSKMILHRGEYKPWWEEQSIRDADLCFELDEDPFDDTHETSSESQEREDVQLLPESRVTEPQSSASSLGDHGNSHQLRGRNMTSKDGIHSEAVSKLQSRGAKLGRQMSNGASSHLPSAQPVNGKIGAVSRYAESRDSLEAPKSLITDRYDLRDNLISESSQSALASSMTLPEIEKKKLRPSPLKIQSTKQKRSHAHQASDDTTTPIKPSITQQKSSLPEKKRDSDTSSSFWSHSGRDGEMNTPATSPEYGKSNRDSKNSTESTESEIEDDIIDSYLNAYEADVAPALPERNPRRMIVVGKNDGTGRKQIGHEYMYIDDAKNGTKNNPNVDGGDRGGDQERDVDDERTRWEDFERHQRVKAILGRLRGNSTGTGVDGK